MKIALVTMDGKTISQHYGRSPYYIIYTIENDVIVEQELRRRGTGHFAPNAQHEHHEHEHGHSHEEGHGFGDDADGKHASMAQEIGDCKVLVAGMMGRGAYQAFVKEGIEVVMTDFVGAQEAAMAYIKGNLPNLSEERTH